MTMPMAAVRLPPEQWAIIREMYAETYPVRPLLNHVDELRAALKALYQRYNDRKGIPYALDQQVRAALDACHE
jgi:hypothetical protein